MATSPLQEHINAVIRTGYRYAYFALRAWWFVRRPQTHGAAVALWREGKVLLIRTSYRSCLSLPGGFVRSGEPSEQAARRELKEELDISLPRESLRHAWHGMIPFESRRDAIDIWETRVDASATPCVTGREIVWAGWIAPAEALDRPLLPHVAVYLAQAGRRTESPSL
jgi:8-oxo-dGTP pyrophosphatase MutT (NUDIX family)